MASPRILNREKKNITENPTITSLAEKSNRWQIPQCPILPIQSKSSSTANQTQHSTANQTQRETQRTQRDRGFYLKKKKIPKYTNKNQTPANPRSRRRDAAARSSSPSSLVPHRRSEIGLCSGAPSGPPSRVFLSFSLSLYLTVTKMKNGTKSL